MSGSILRKLWCFYAAFSCCQICPAQEVVPFGSSWEYLHPTDAADPASTDVDFAATWHTPSQYDGPAFSGPAPAILGYGTIDGHEIATHIGEPLSGDRYTAYFRTTITLSEEFEPLEFEFIADDGGVLYVDGEAVFNLRYSGDDTYFAPAQGGHFETETTRVFLDRRLSAGQHTIAFSLHNFSPESSDLGFDLRIAESGGLLSYISWEANDGEVAITGTESNVVGSLVIPNMIDGLPVTSIGDEAFSGSDWSSIVLPDSLATIGEMAFAGCRGLTGVTFPDGLISIGDQAFSGCVSLQSVVLPDSLEIIGSEGFRYCVGLTEVVIPDSVTSIGSEAFRNCNNLASLTLGIGLESIGRNTFAGTGIVFQESGDLKYLTSLAAAFLVDGSLATGAVIVPDQFAGVPVRNVFAFSGNDNIRSVTIPGTVLRIESSEFEGCARLMSVTISEGVTEIGDSAFSDSNLSDVSIPDGVKRIGDEAFSHCHGLTNIVLPASVSSIGSRAFHFAGLESVLIPVNVTTLEDYTFADCRLLTEVIIPAGATSIGRSAFNGCTRLEAVTVPSGVTSIGASAFAETGLSTVDLPESTIVLGSSVFARSSLSSIVMPSGITSVPADAFLGCSNLASVTIPDGVTLIGDQAFQGCTSLVSITLPDSLTSLGHEVFSGCTLLTGIVIPEGVTQFERRVFKDCVGLTSMTIPNGVAGLDTEAFDGCTNLASVVVPGSVTYIGERVFRDCVNLTNVDLTDGLTTIGGAAFINCSRLASIAIPNTVTTIGAAAFANCIALTGLSIPDGVIVVETSICLNCISLASVSLPDIVARLESRAFAGCTSLTAVTIPGSVVAFEFEVFRDCNSLGVVSFAGAAPGSVLADSFSGLPAGATAIVSVGHAESFGGGGADWNGLVVIVPSEINQILLTGDSLTIRFTGEAGMTDWKVMGAADLVAFDEDLTADTTVVETAPGEYEAVVNIAGKPDDYFIRVER